MEKQTSHYYSFCIGGRISYTHQVFVHCYQSSIEHLSLLVPDLNLNLLLQVCLFYSPFLSSSLSSSIMYFQWKQAQQLRIFCIQLSHGKCKKLGAVQTLVQQGKSRLQSVLILANHYFVNLVVSSPCETCHIIKSHRN